MGGVVDVAKRAEQRRVSEGSLDDGRRDPALGQPGAMHVAEVVQAKPLHPYTYDKA